MTLTTQEQLNRFIGGQLQMVMDGLEIRMNVETIATSPEGVLIGSDVYWRKKRDDADFTPSPGGIHLLMEARIDEDELLVGEIRIRWYSKPIQGTVYPPGYADILRFELPTTTLEEVVREHGTVAVKSVFTDKEIIVHRVLVDDEKWIGVVRTVFPCPFTNLVNTGIKSIKLEEGGIFRVDGFLKSEDGGMSHASCPIKGWGKTIAEAVAAAYNSEPVASYRATHPDHEVEERVIVEKYDIVVVYATPDGTILEQKYSRRKRHQPKCLPYNAKLAKSSGYLWKLRQRQMRTASST